MPVLKRELAFAAERPMADTGDWWHLVLDTDGPGLYVEHTWTRSSGHGSGELIDGAQRFGINDFLTLSGEERAHSMLLAALGEMFRDREP